MKLLEKFLLSSFILSFAMPFIRISYNGVLWPAEYLQSSLSLPRLIEVILILFFLLLLLKKYSFDDLIEMFNKDKVFRLFLFVLLYVSFIQPLLMRIFPLVRAPTAKGVIRGSLTVPIIAYIVGYRVVERKYAKKTIILSLILAGLLQAIAMLAPNLFPGYMIFGNFGYFPVELTTGETLNLQRQAGFWDRSSQAAAFMAIIICLAIACYIHFKSKKIRVFLLVSIGVLMVALLSSLQRLPFIAILALFLFIMFGRSVYAKPRLNKKLIPILLLLMIFVFSIIQYPYLLKTRLSLSSLGLFLEDYRFKYVWPAYFTFIFKNPSVLFFGAGFGCDALGEYRMPMRMMHGHNQFITWVASIGFPMTIIFVSSLINIYNRAKVCILSRIMSVYEKTFVAFCMMLLFVILVISFAESPLLSEPISILVFFVSGLMGSLYINRIEETTREKT